MTVFSLFRDERQMRHSASYPRVSSEGCLWSYAGIKDGCHHAWLDTAILKVSFTNTNKMVFTPFTPMTLVQDVTEKLDPS